jgi:hypothetical protein
MKRVTNRAIERLEEQILEDESLRRGLSDIGSQPLLDWALSRLRRRTPSRTRIDAFGRQLRTVLASAALTSSTGDPTHLRPHIGPPLFSKSEAATIRDRLTRLTLAADADQNAIQIAGALSERT